MNIYFRPSAKQEAHKAIEDALTEEPAYSIISVEMFIEVARRVYSRHIKHNWN